MFKVQVIIFNILIVLILTGGLIFNRIDLSNTDVWGAIFLSLFFINKSSRDYFFNKTEAILYYKKSFLLIFVFLFSTLFLSHFFKYLSFNTSGMDQTFVHQSILNGLSTPLLKCDYCNFGTYFGEHTSPVLIFLTPIYNLFRFNFVLYFIETILVFGGVLLIIRNSIIDKKLWVFAFVVIFASRALRNSLVWDIREDHLAFFFICLSFMFLNSGSLILYFMSITLVLISKEHLPYIVPFFIFPIFFEPKFKLNKKKRYIASIITIILSVAWLIILSKYIVPFYTGDVAKNHIVHRFPGFGTTNKEVVLNILMQPWAWKKLLFERVFTLGAIKYTFFIFITFISLCYKRWWFLLAAFPAYAMNLLSYAGTQRMMIFHYDLPLLAVLIVGTCLAISEMDKKRISICLLIAVSISGKWPMHYVYKYFPSYNDIKDREFFSSLNEDEIYATGILTSSQISHHKKLRIFQNLTALSFNEFLKLNSKKSIAPALDISDSKFFILDLNNKDEKRLYELSILENITLLKSSYSKRFVLLENKHE